MGDSKPGDVQDTKLDDEDMYDEDYEFYEERKWFKRPTKCVGVFSLLILGCWVISFVSYRWQHRIVDISVRDLATVSEAGQMLNGLAGLAKIAGKGESAEVVDSPDREPV